MNRVAIFGLDGATFNLIKPWVKEGKLPNIGALMEAGIYGELKSTIPPISPVAWASFQTGTNPGKHGIFNWFRRRKGSYDVTTINSSLIKKPTVWEIISSQGRRVGVISVPVTYPPRRVNGFLIPGLLTPEAAKDNAYPQELLTELRKVAPDYRYAPQEWTRGLNPKRWVKGLKDMIDARKKATLYFIRTQEWDLMMVHFMATDTVQHFMWHTLEGEWDPILEVYQKVDEAIGEILAELDNEVSVIVMSDHGFGPLKYEFHINTWLLQEGYLRLRKDPVTSMKKALFKAGLTQENFYPLGSLLYPLATRLGIMKTGLDVASNRFLKRAFLSSYNVDWFQTKTYSYAEVGHIYLNLKGREPEGCVDPKDADRLREEIITKLKELKNPATGRRIVGRVFKREELYSGEALEMAPDILFLPNDMEIRGNGALMFLSNRVVSGSLGRTGGHRMEGIYIAKGRNFKRSLEIEKVRIIDLAPTILYHLGLSIPSDMDGKVIEELFTEDYLKRHPVGYAEQGIGHAVEASGEKRGEWEEEIRRRLQGLGYI